MERDNHRKFWSIMSVVSVVSVLVFLCFSNWTDAQIFGKPRLLRIFREGADWYHKGDYEKAKACFDQVKARADELKPEYRADLLKWIEYTDLALTGRQKYEEIQVKLQAAYDEGRLDDAVKYLRELKVNPYGGGSHRPNKSSENLPAQRDNQSPLPAIRDFIQAAANQVKKKDTALPYIDAHVHVWTSDLAKYPLAPGYKMEDVRPASFTPEELLKHAKPAQVGRIALIQISSYGFDNSYILDMIAKHPDIFVGTALIDPYNDPVAVMDKMAKQGVRAFRIQPKLSKEPIGRWLRPDGFARMFEAGARNNQAMSCLIDPDALPEVDRMCTAYPNTPVIIDHLARIGVDGEIRPRDVDALCALAKHKKVMVKIGAFYALGKKKAPYTDLGPMIEKTVKAFGADRCMWESDCPFQVEDGHTYQDSIDLVRKGLNFLSDADKDWLLTKTAERFFFAKK